MTVEQGNGDEVGDGDSLDGEQSGVTPDEMEDLEEMVQCRGEEQKETIPETWGSRLRPRKSQGRLQT